jgi:hypothetical protein
VVGLFVQETNMKNSLPGLSLCLTALLLGAASGLLSSGASVVGGGRLSDYRGGTITAAWCVGAETDDNALHCQECTSDGNGHYVKCDSDGTNKMFGDSIPTPWKVVLDTNTACGGIASKYGVMSQGFCSLPLGLPTETCGRTYTKLVGLGIDSTRNCN